MSDQFIGEIRMFAGNFAPAGWALCNGQLLLVTQNTALFAIIGTTYGGNGTTNFAVPNLQGIAPMQPGQGAGLSNHDLGETAGVTTVTLTPQQSAAHSHLLQANTAVGNSATPSGNVYRFSRSHVAPNPPAAVETYSTQAPDTFLNPTALATTGGVQGHNNLMPYLAVTFIIALTGMFPPRP